MGPVRLSVLYLTEGAGCSARLRVGAEPRVHSRTSARRCSKCGMRSAECGIAMPRSNRKCDRLSQCQPLNSAFRIR